jgi:hypothetical protein
MDYAHHFAFDPTGPAYTQAWPRIIADTAVILTAVTKLGIAITGPDSHGAPILDPARHIAFNGGTSADPLRLPAPYPAAVPPNTASPVTGRCRTRLHPYDLAVATVLLRCHMHLGDGFPIASTGRYDNEWLYGVRPGQPGARQLIRLLFGAEPAGDPLQQSWPDHRSGRPPW